MFKLSSKPENARMWTVDTLKWIDLNTANIFISKVFYWNVDGELSIWVIHMSKVCSVNETSKYEWTFLIVVGTSNALAREACRFDVGKDNGTFHLPLHLPHAICRRRVWVWCIFNVRSKLLLAPLIQAFWQTFC